MKASFGRRLPLAPLLRAYADAGIPGVEQLSRLPGLGPRFRAVCAARAQLLDEAFLDLAPASKFQSALARFSAACIEPPPAAEVLDARGGIVRHALGHLLRCPDSFLRKAERCLDPGGAYHVAGLGPDFWSALFQALDPMRYPAWTPATEAGLRRLGLARWRPTRRPGRVYAAILDTYARIRALEPALTPLHVDHFLTLVAGMPGRDLFAGAESCSVNLPARTAEIGGRRNEPARFGGFCPDTFRFLAELGENNSRTWMDRQRGRYRFAVREPLVELCRALTERYVGPVLGREHGWDMETAARSGRALTSICKNDYGRSVPYQTALWITFDRREPGAKRSEVQLFVRLDPAGLRYGLFVGRGAPEAMQRFRRNVQQHGDLLFQALRDGGALSACVFGDADGAAESRLASAADLRCWAEGKSLMVAKTVPAGTPLLTTDELVGDILLTFDHLLPAYACALEADPLPLLARRTGTADRRPRYTDADFAAATFLGADWLRRARDLLALKRQLILQGVPGTSKTHVARCLARLLTRGHADQVRLVQFHPAYSYEEFVEGIKARSVEVDGRHDVTYPVEDGLLCAFAAEAAGRPAEPHVLVIDDINRGNLPRIFGELLYLLEYRDQEVVLPYSRQPFRLPANLYLIGTMNAADRSVALVDQALRRRFSFLDMPPDAAVLAAWLKDHPPPAGAAFAGRVVRLFERLNARLAADLGPLCQVGHSYFMVGDLDEDRLAVVWEHHVRPLLEEYFAGHRERLAPYRLEKLLGDGPRRKAGRRPAAVSG
jgi:hypothetical protein